MLDSKFRPLYYGLRVVDASAFSYDLFFNVDGQSFKIEHFISSTEIVELARLSRTKRWNGHEDVAALGSRWLSTCREYHPNCSSNNSRNWKPTRLLNISTDSIELVVTAKDEIRGDYATLSHCWGREPMSIVLNSETLPRFLKGVPVEELPLTFQHAITIVRRLDIMYLWIDCFCIIQGDQKDWEDESRQMGNVYQNGLINIGAATTDSARKGIFVRKTPSSVRHSIIK